MPFLKESVGSLRAYFIVVGVVSVLYGVLAVAGADGAMDLIDAVLGLAFGAALIYVGAAFPRLLDAGSTLVRNILYLWIAMAALEALVRIVMGFPAAGIASLALRGVIALYLISNVNRLMVERRGAGRPDAALGDVPRARPYVRPPWEKPPVPPSVPAMSVRGETKLCAGYKHQIPVDAIQCPTCGAR